MLELKQNLSKLVNASDDITDDPTQLLSHNSDQNYGNDPYIRDPSQLVDKVITPSWYMILPKNTVHLEEK